MAKVVQKRQNRMQMTQIKIDFRGLIQKICVNPLNLRHLPGPPMRFYYYLLCVGLISGAFFSRFSFFTSSTGAFITALSVKSIGMAS